MRRIEWPVPLKRKGQLRAKASFKLNRAFAEAVRQYSVKESQRAGRQVSQAVTLEVSALLGNPSLRRQLSVADLQELLGDKEFQRLVDRHEILLPRSQSDKL